YRGIFNGKRGFMPTSRMQKDTLGQDTLYGATLTYAAFGRKVLTDEQVLTHYRTSEKVKTRYGLRVISAADGSLLPGHNGVYCHGGSWFFCDSELPACRHSRPAGRRGGCPPDRAHQTGADQESGVQRGHQHRQRHAPRQLA